MYAAELAATDPTAERDDAIHRLLDYYLRTAHAGSALIIPGRDPIALPSAPEPERHDVLTDVAGAFAWFTAEENVLIAAVHQSAAYGFDEYTAGLVWAISPYLNRRTPPQVSVPLMELALRATDRAGDAALHFRTRHGLAQVYRRLGLFDNARELLNQALDYFTEVGDLPGQDRINRELTTIARRENRPADMLHHALLSLEICKLVGNPTMTASALTGVATAYGVSGDSQQAVHYGQLARTTAQESGDAETVYAATRSLAVGYHLRGDHSHAVELLRAALEEAGKLWIPETQVQMLDDLGESQYAAGDHAGAHDSWREAAAILRGLGFDPTAVAALDNKAAKTQQPIPPPENQ